MAFVCPNLVQETTTTTGQGTVTLLGAVTGALDFDSQLANGDTVPYTIENTTQKEVGIGTFSTSGPTLARTTVLFSTNGDALEDFSAGTKNVFASLPGELVSSLVDASASDGLVVQTAAQTYARRDVTASKGIQVTNGDGVSGNIAINSGFLSVKDEAYGAVGDGVSDDTSAISACITAAEASGDMVLLEPGDYLISGSCLTFTKGIHFKGAGNSSRLIVKSDVGSSTDIITISPSTTTDDFNTKFLLEGFRIEPESGTPGRHGIAIDIGTRAMYNSIIRNIRIDQLNTIGWGIRTLPAGTPLVDGFFTSTIEESTIYGGIYLDGAGDSIRILRNTITGTNVGVYADLVCNSGCAGQTGGPHGLEIIGNNITCDSGALDVRNAWQGLFERNVVEVPNPNTMYHLAPISIDGVPSNPTRGFTVRKNLLSSASGNDTINVGNAFGTLIEDNLCVRIAGRHTYKISSDAVNTKIINNTEALDETRETVLDDSGTTTWWLRSWGGIIETNQNLYMDQGKQVYYRDSADDLQSILALETADDTCKIGFTSAVTDPDQGHLLMYANGTEYMRISPIGTVIVGGAGPAVSAVLQVDSTSQGFLLPRMTTTQKNNIGTPVAGLMVYDTVLQGISFYNGSAWITSQA